MNLKKLQCFQKASCYTHALHVGMEICCNQVFQYQYFLSNKGWTYKQENLKTKFALLENNNRSSMLLGYFDQKLVFHSVFTASTRCIFIHKTKLIDKRELNERPCQQKQPNNAAFKCSKSYLETRTRRGVNKRSSVRESMHALYWINSDSLIALITSSFCNTLYKAQ